MYFYLYSRLRSLAVSRNSPVGAPGGGSKDIGVLASLAVAALAGAGNQLVTMPASVVATRMQAQAKLRMEGGADVPTGALHVISSIWGEGGLGGFWAGFLPSLMLVVNPAVQYMLYEQLLRLLRKWKKERGVARQQLQLQKSEGDASAAPAEGSSGQLVAPATGAPPQDAVKLSAGEIFIASALAKIGATGRPLQVCFILSIAPMPPIIVISYSAWPPHLPSSPSS